MTLATVTLGELALKLQDGPFGSNLKSEHYVDEGVRVVRLQNIGVGHFDDRDRAFISPAHFEALRKHECRSGDLLLATLGDPILRAAIQPDSLPFALNKADCIQLRCDPRKVSAAYLAHYLNSGRAQSHAGALAHGQTRPRINLSQLRELPVPLPPIEEQRRIAAVLDAADALRAKRRQALAKLDTLTQAIFIDMFGTPENNVHRLPEYELGDLVEVKGGKRLPKGSDYATQPTGLPYIRVTDFRDGAIDLEDLRFLTPDVQRAIHRYTVSAGDVIISIAGSIGQIASVPVELDGANLTENAAKLVRRDPGALSTEYLASFLRSRFAQQQISAKTGQVTIGKLALFRIASLKVLLPPSELQQRYEDAILGIRRTAPQLDRSRRGLDSLFAWLQQRAFRGEL